MWTVQASQIQIALLCSSVFVLTNSLGTLHGREKVLERQRRAALTKWSQPVRSPAAAAPSYASPATSAAGRSYAQPATVNVPQAQTPYIPQVSYPQYSSYSTTNTAGTQSQYNAASYAANPALYQQYATQQKNSAYSTAGQTPAYNTAGQSPVYNTGGQTPAYNGAAQKSAYNGAGQTPAYNNNPYANYNAAAMTSNPITSNIYQNPQQQQLTNAGYGSNAYGNPTAANGQAANYYGTGTNMQNAYNTGYNPQMQAAAANMYNNGANFNPSKYKNPYVNSAYPSVQSGFAKNQYAQPGSPEYERQNYALYQDPQRTPMQYGYNYNPANGATGQAGQVGQRYPYNGNMGGYGQGRSGQSPPMVTPPPQQTAQQYELSEFCKKPDREPKCRKNSFGMCDYQENYPSDAATEFFAFHKSRITAMTTDSDYSNSDLYDTGFATQQNKLIDFVHDIFSDNEYGNLPGVPPEKKGLCIGLSDTIQPGWAKTSHGKYYVIMNSNNVKQTIRAEVCKNAGKGCQTVPKCYKSECRQRYRFDTLLVFDPCDAKRAPMLELFKIPDGCECFVIVEEPDLIPPEFPVQPTSTTPKQPNAVAAGRADVPSSAIIASQEKVIPHTTLPGTSTIASSASASTVQQPKNTTETIPTTKQTIILSPR